MISAIMVMSIGYNDDSEDDKDDNDEEGAPPRRQNVNFSTVIPFVLLYFRRYIESSTDLHKSSHKKNHVLFETMRMTLKLLMLLATP